jgi:hypothetical protein
MKMDKILESCHAATLSQDNLDQVEAFVTTVAERHPNVDTGSLFDVSMNTAKYYAAIAEYGAGMVQDDTDLYRDISMIITGKFWTGSMINELASTQVLDNIYGYIYRLQFEYADDHAADSITAGQTLGAVRSSSYASDPGEQSPARRLKAELRRELVEATIRPLELSQTFHSILRRASVLGKGSKAGFDNKMLQTAYVKLRDELEMATILRLPSIVPAGNKVNFTDPIADPAKTCSEKECEYGLFFEALADASNRVHVSTGLYPNVVMLGTKGLRLVERWIKTKPNEMWSDMIPQKGRMGVFAKRWMVYYDPAMGDKAVVGVFNPDDPTQNPILYAPYIALGVSPEIFDRDLSTSQVVFSVDRVDITEPTLFGQVTIV